MAVFVLKYETKYMTYFYEKNVANNLFEWSKKRYTPSVKRLIVSSVKACR